MKSEIIVTDDNSKTLLIPELNETYHSTKGAITEALHVYIKEGLLHSKKKKLKIFEMGFGTGLNALLTLDHSIKNNTRIDYYCVEAFPLTFEQANTMNYLSTLKIAELSSEYEKMHNSDSNSSIQLSDNFSFTKYILKIEEIDLEANQFDVIYYDAFGPKVQPDLWSEEVLTKILGFMKPGGLLVTYCAQGAFKRTLKAIGFEVESIPGPPGKREMTRAVKHF